MPNVSTDVSFGPASRCAVLMSSCVSFDGVLISPNCETNPRQKVPEISPIFTADNAKLHVSRETGNCAWFAPDGTTRRSCSRTVAGKLAGEVGR